MEFLLASDRNFVAHTATTAASILTWNPGSRIHWIQSGFSTRLERKLQRFVSKLGGVLALYEADMELFQTFLVDKHASVANYFRLQAPHLLPDEVTRVLYLDSDALVRRPLGELWSTDLQGHWLAACQDQGSEKLAKSLDLEPDCYFNSGVMLIPLELWRGLSLEEEFYSYIRRNNHKLKYWDQDALNAVVRGRWLPLSFSYNAQHLLYVAPARQVAYQELLEDPHVVHFSGGGVKPWQSKLVHPLKSDYRHYRKMTPWPWFREEQQTRRPYGNRIRSTILGMWDETLPASHLGRTIQAGVRRTKVFKKLQRARMARSQEREQERLRSRRQGYVEHQKRVSRFRRTYFGSDTRVRTGPFTGMKCLESSVGSQVLPKIAGTYEQPIQHIIASWIANNCFSRVINIGCAEGYYAVGLALGLPKTSVIAFDRSAEARHLCAELAAINGVRNRLEVLGECDPQTLDQICDATSLLLCDIEGAEVDLLDPAQVRSLKHTEILVETHDFLRPGVTDSLVARLQASHAITMVVDYPRNSRALEKVLQAQGVAASPEDIRFLVDEQRPAGMRWLHMVPIGIESGRHENNVGDQDIS